MDLLLEVKEIIKDYVREIDIIHCYYDNDYFRYKDNNLGHRLYIGFWIDGTFIDISYKSSSIGLYENDFHTNLKNKLQFVPSLVNIVDNNLLYLNKMGFILSYDLFKQTEKVILTTKLNDCIDFHDKYIIINDITELKIYNSDGELINKVPYNNQRTSSHYSYTVGKQDIIERINHLTGKNNKYQLELVDFESETNSWIIYEEYLIRKGYFYHFKDDDTYIKINLRVEYIIKIIDKLVYYFSEGNIYVIDILTYQWRLIYDKIYTEDNNEIIYDIYIREIDL